MEIAKGARKMENKTSLKKILIVLVVLVCLVLLGFFVIKQIKNRGEPEIIATNFVGYDFARAITDDKESVSMLLKPGTDIHSFEPTPSDIIAIEKAKLFIYIGGESDEWVEKLIESNEIKRENTLRLMDFVEPKTEENDQIMEDDDSGENEEETDEAEYDEHIWTSPLNAIKMIEGIEARLSTIEPEKTSFYKQNADKYIERIKKIDQEIRSVVETSSRKELIFADRFPFRYFVDEYGLNYVAAFPGCAEQTEASSSTIAALVDEIKGKGIKTILKIEMSSGKLADLIAAETGTGVQVLNSAHNISKEDLENGTTYVDIMESNIDVLRKVLE